MKKPPEWLKIDFILGYFGKNISDSQRSYKIFVNILSDQKYESPLKDVVSSTILGTQDFIELIKDKHLSTRKEEKDLPTLKPFLKKIAIEDIHNEVDRILKYDMKLSRNIKVYLSQRHTGENLDAIGRHFDIGGSAVCHIAKKIFEQSEKDKNLAKTIKKIEDNLSRFKV